MTGENLGVSPEEIDRLARLMEKVSTDLERQLTEVLGREKTDEILRQAGELLRGFEGGFNMEAMLQALEYGLGDLINKSWEEKNVNRNLF